MNNIKNDLHMDGLNDWIVIKGGSTGGKGGWDPKLQFYFPYVGFEVSVGSSGKMFSCSGSPGEGSSLAL